MTTLYDGYSAPEVCTASPIVDGIVMTYGTDIRGGLVEVQSTHGAMTLYPVVNSTYTGMQVQHRIRHRYNYASGLLVDDSGAEVWTEYPDWTEPSGATAMTSVAWYNWQNVRYAAGQSIAVSYDLSQYDMHEIEVRARVYSSQYDRCSAWAYRTTRVVYRPELSSCSAQTMADGSLSVTWGTNWPRGATLRASGLVQREETYSSGRYLANDRYTASELSSGEGIDLAVPPKRLVASPVSLKGSMWALSMSLGNADGAGTAEWLRREPTSQTRPWADDGGCSLVAKPNDEGYLVQPGAHIDPQDVPVPTLSVISDDGEAVVIGVTCACDHVLAHVEYTDADGNAYTADMEPAGTSPDWTVTLMSPPYGVEITVKVACCNASGAYRLATETVEIASDGHCTLDGDGDHVALAYEGEYQAKTDLDGESVICAGRKLPVSRHGMSVSRSIDVKGTIAFPSVFPWGDMELSGLNVLDNPHDWTFRNPKGVRKRVRVTSWSVDQDTEQLGRVAEVTINMEEVG